MVKRRERRQSRLQGHLELPNGGRVPIYSKAVWEALSQREERLAKLTELLTRQSGMLQDARAALERVERSKTVRLARWLGLLRIPQAPIDRKPTRTASRSKAGAQHGNAGPATPPDGREGANPRGSGGPVPKEGDDAARS